MATLINCATGNFTTSTTWAICDSTSLLDSEAANTVLTTSYVASSNFTPGIIIVDGIAVKVATTAASPSGTMSVKLYNATDLADVAVVTINVSDLPTQTSAGHIGWAFFKFASSQTLIAAKAYNVQATTSVATQVYLYRDGTANNWSRLLRTTTTQAPAAGDSMHAIGEYTGAGTSNAFTVTMNNTDTTDFGGGSTTLASLSIGKYGTLTWGTAASTNYNLRLSGLLIVYSNGTYNMGTTGTPMPSTSTAKLEFDCAADGNFGFIAKNGSAINIQGNPLSYDRCKLNTDEAIGQTILGVDTNTGWVNGQEIGIASTSQTYSECEKRTVSSSDATTVTVTAGLTYAHSGTSPTQAELINLTRNVKICAVTSTLVGYVCLETTAAVDIDWVEFYYLGEDVADKRGINVKTTTGSANIQNCSLHDSEDYGFYITGTSANNITFSNNVCYNASSASGNVLYIAQATNGTNITFNNNIVMLSALASCYGLYLADIGGTFTDNTIVGMNGTGIRFGESNAILGTYSGNTIHSTANNGLYFVVAGTSGTVSSTTIWRSNLGITFSGNGSNNLTFNTAVIFGCAQSSVYFMGVSAYKITFNNVTSNGEAGYATNDAIRFYGDGACYSDISINNCNFGSTYPHSVADIVITSTTNAPLFITAKCYNTIMASSPEVLIIGTESSGSYVKSQDHDQVLNAHRSWFKHGQADKDTSVYHTATPSLKITPSNTTYNCDDVVFQIPADNGVLTTIKMWTRWDSSNTPSQKPKITLSGLGITPSSATNASATTVWEELTVSGTPTRDGCLELKLECNKSSSATSCYFDDLSVT